MKIKRTISGLLLMSILLGMMILPCSVSAGTNVTSQEYLDEQMEKYDISGVAYVTKNGNVLCQSTRGMANTAESKKITVDTLFPIGSISKQFCAVAVFMLEEQGRLSLDDTLSEYFPEYTKAENVTIRQMLIMRSGIRDFQEGAFKEFFPSTDCTQEENQQLILDWLYNKSLRFKPGSGYYYSNTNTLLLSMIIEKITGKDYEDFIKENIFEPLCMDNTGFYEELVNNPNLCESTFPEDIEVVRSTDTKGCFQGCGDLVTNAEDMDKWLTSLRECTLISKESIDVMTTVYTTNVDIVNGMSVGYAHSVKVTGDGCVCHTGFIDTYVSGALTNFEEELNVFVVANNVDNLKVDMLELSMSIATEFKSMKICGDANCDGTVNIKDATVIQKHVANLIVLKESELALADVDASSNVNIKDATAIQKYIAGMVTGFPIGNIVK